MAVTSNAGSVFAVLTGTDLTGFLCLSVLHPDDVVKPARISRTRGLTFVRRLKEGCSDGGADDRFYPFKGRVEKPVKVMPGFPPEVARLLRDSRAFGVL